MCTVLLAHRVIPGVRLLVVANRDERLGRPSSPPFVWPEGFVAPRDDVAGGTWLGVNQHGVFVAITNRQHAFPDPSRLSRGRLVEEALHLTSARAIHESARTIPGDRHNGFHLVYADDDDVLATFADGATIAQTTLGAGVHFVTERSFGAGDDRARIARIREAWSEATRSAGSSVASLAPFTRVLAGHDASDPFAAPCVHVPGFDYGTRSAMVLAIPERTARSESGENAAETPRMLWAEGPPCTAPFAPIVLSSLQETR